VCVEENFYRVIGPDGEAHNRVEAMFVWSMRNCAVSSPCSSGSRTSRSSCSMTSSVSG
jgi:hypothetical protein